MIETAVGMEAKNDVVNVDKLINRLTSSDNVYQNNS